MNPNDSSPRDRSEPEPVHPQLRTLNSEDLLCGEKVVLIAHHGEIYRLCETRNGKLILGK